MEALGMSNEEFSLALNEGFFPRELIAKFGSIEKFDLEGLLEFGRTGLFPVETNSSSGRALLRRLLQLEVSLFQIQAIYQTSVVDLGKCDPISNFTAAIQEKIIEFNKIEEYFSSYGWLDRSDFSKMDKFDLEERIEFLAQKFEKAADEIKVNCNDLSLSLSEIQQFFQLSEEMEEILSISAKNFFADLNFPFEDAPDIDDAIEYLSTRDIQSYITYVEMKHEE